MPMKLRRLTLATGSAAGEPLPQRRDLERGLAAGFHFLRAPAADQRVGEDRALVNDDGADVDPVTCARILAGRHRVPALNACDPISRASRSSRLVAAVSRAQFFLFSRDGAFELRVDPRLPSRSAGAEVVKDIG
jgi:hypothetical protein